MVTVDAKTVNNKKKQSVPGELESSVQHQSAEVKAPSELLSGG